MARFCSGDQPRRRRLKQAMRIEIVQIEQRVKDETHFLLPCLRVRTTSERGPEEELRRRWAGYGHEP